MKERNLRKDYNVARDGLKLIAIAVMTLDHISSVFFPLSFWPYEICQFLGDFTIVIMCYFIVQGVKYTHSVLHYALRMLFWALFSQVPFSLLFGKRLNVIFTLLASMLAVVLIDRKGIVYGLIALIIYFPISLIADWSMIAPSFALVYYYTEKYQRRKISLMLIPLACFFFRSLLYSGTMLDHATTSASVFLSSILVYFIGARADRKAKGIIPGFFFYAYYPVHLLIIYALWYSMYMI